MSRLTAGYFASNFWPENYFHDWYWPNYGEVLSTNIKVRFKTSLTLKQEFKTELVTNKTFNTSLTLKKVFK